MRADFIKDFNGSQEQLSEIFSSVTSMVIYQSNYDQIYDSIDLIMALSRFVKVAVNFFLVSVCLFHCKFACIL